MTMTHQLLELEREGWSLPLMARRKTERDRAYRRRQEIRTAIERLAVATPLPFSTQDNGVHVYHETTDYLVFRNHGSAYWVGLVKSHGGYAVAATNLDPGVVLRGTIQAASEAAQ